MLGLALALLPTLLRIGGSIATNDGWEYEAAEWLINNRGGGTRRGLAGDLLLSVPGLTAQAAVVLTVTVLLVAVTVGFAWLVRSAIRRSGSGWPLLLWLLPGGLVLGTLQANLHGMSQSATSFAVRKEYLFLALLLAVVLTATYRPGRRAWWGSAAAGAVLCGAGALVHEALAFVTAVILTYFLLRIHPAPPTSAITIRRPGSPGRFVVPVALLLLAPVTLALGLVGALDAGVQADYRGAWAAVDSGTRAWLSVPTVHVWGADAGFPAPFWWLTAQPSDAVEWLVRDYLQTGLWLPWLIVAIIVPLWAFVGATLIDSTRRARVGHLTTIAVVLGAFVPLWLLSVDWGRWITLAGVFIAILILGQTVFTGRAARPAPATVRVRIVAGALILTSLAVTVPVAGGEFWLARLLT